MSSEERWAAVGLLALAGAMYGLAWLLAGPPGAYLDLATGAG